jgi:hypothetical protein
MELGSSETYCREILPNILIPVMGGVGKVPSNPKCHMRPNACKFTCIITQRLMGSDSVSHFCLCQTKQSNVAHKR